MLTLRLQSPTSGTLIGRELQPVYAAIDKPTVGSTVAAPALPVRLLELLQVAGQHLYHDITGASSMLAACFAAQALCLPGLPDCATRHCLFSTFGL